MPESGVGDNDRVALTFLGAVSLPTLLGLGAVLWNDGVRWLVAHGVLVGAAEHPLLPLPGLAGAGLDAPRLTIAVAVVVGLLVVALSAARRAWAARQVSGG